MTTSKIRIVVDPNIIGSVLLGGITRKRYLWLLNHLQVFEICYSDTLIDEVLRFPQSPFFQSKGIGKEVVNIFLYDFRSYALKIIVVSKVKIGRDVNDYFLLSLCRDARADFLTTGDPDLLLLRQYGQTRIISFKDFFDLFSVML